MQKILISTISNFLLKAYNYIQPICLILFFFNFINLHQHHQHSCFQLITYNLYLIIYNLQLFYNKLYCPSLIQPSQLVQPSQPSFLQLTTYNLKPTTIPLTTCSLVFLIQPFQLVQPNQPSFSTTPCQLKRTVIAYP